MLVVFGATFITAFPTIYFINVAGRRRPSHHVGRLTVDSEPLVYLPVSTSAKCSYLLLSVTSLVAFGSWPVFAWLVEPDGSYGEARFRLLAPVAPIFGLYFLAVLCISAVRKRKELGLGLAPEGIYSWTWFGCCFFAWDWISAIHLSSRTGPGANLIVHEPLPLPRIREENWIARLNNFRRKKERLNFGFLAINPAIAYHALRFYHQHPEHRAELSTDTAVERVRQGNLPT